MTQRRLTYPKGPITEPDEPYVMSELERSTFIVTGTDASSPRLTPLVSDPSTVARYLEDGMVPALKRGPCFVAFSGGRDSSVVLAAATASARRHGLPDPVPLTLRFRDAPGTDESSWQELVIKHLGIRDWIRTELADELDIVGPVAAPLLRRYGPMWPPNSHFLAPMAEHAKGGSLFTGLGGDELFTPNIPREYWVLNRLERPRPRDAVAIAGLVVPRALRARMLRRHIEPLPWLKPAAVTPYVREVAELSVPRYPWGRTILDFHMRSRERIGSLGSMAAAVGADVRVEHPFWDREFVCALAGTFWRMGFKSRTRAMHALFEDLLPREITHRPDKAAFFQPFIGTHSRAFIRDWDGDGVNTDLVDADVLRSVWSKPDVDARSWPLLQQAWRLASSSR